MPSFRRGPDFGNSFAGPVRTRRPFGIVGASGRGAAAGINRPLSNDAQFEDESLGWNPRSRAEIFDDFFGIGAGIGNSENFYLPLSVITSDAGTNVIPIASGSVALFEFVVPRGGVVTLAELVTQDLLETDNTNYVTFTITNLLGAATGSTAVLAASPTNTTRTTGGAKIFAEIPYPFTLNATAVNLNVAAGDVLRIAATVTGTLANIVDAPVVHIRISSATGTSGIFVPRTVRTAGSPLMAPLTATANGVVEGLLSATNEVQYAGIDMGDASIVPMNKGFKFEAFVRIPTAITTAQDVIIGVANTFNSTLASMTRYTWFRLKASMALVAEGADGTTTTLVNDLAFTNPTNEFHLYTIVSKNGMGRNSGFVEFWFDDNFLGKVNIAAADTTLIQPMIGVRKASGTGTPAVDIDYARCQFDRF